MIDGIYDLATTDDPTVVGNLVLYEDGACIMRRWDTEAVQMYETLDDFACGNPGLIRLGRMKLPRKALDPEVVQEAIGVECKALAEFLQGKNQAYGNSALEPLRILSKASPMQGILVRVDDKLNRLLNGGEYPGDNDLKDLVGYLVLYLVGKRLGLS